MKAPLPPFEEARLASLASYEILDTAPEEEYDAIVRLAASLCGTSIAAVTLIDRERQWLKACIGVDLTETSRDVAFCAHTIVSEETMTLVRNTTEDPRFADNPLVTEGGLRFYAGVPLVGEDGFALGSLCVVGFEPRDLDEAQATALRSLARLVVSQLELRRKNRLLREAEAAVRNAEKSKADFLASTGQEIRNPMHGVLGVTDLLDGTTLDDRQRRYVDAIRKGAEGLMRVLDDVLNVAYSDAGEDTYHLAPLHVPSLAEELVDLFRPAALAKGLRLSASVDSRAAEPTVADVGRLRQALMHLLGHALKTTAKGWVEIEIDVQGERAGRKTVRFAIAQSGKGDTQPSSEPVSALGSELRHSAGPESRTWFDLDLPMGPLEKRGGRALLAGDDGVNGLVLSAMLEDRGLSIHGVKSLAEAESACRTESFDFALIDTNMPDMEDYRAALALRRIAPTMPIFLVTAASDAEAAAACLASGARDVLTKPVNARVLDAVLNRWVPPSGA